MKKILLCLTLLCGACPPPAPKPPVPQQAAPVKDRKQEMLEEGRALTKLFYEGQTTELFGRFSEAMKQAVPLWALEPLPVQFRESFGAEKEVIAEGVNLAGKLSIYWRKFVSEKDPTVLVMQWSIGASGSIAGFVISPAQEPAPSQHLDYQTKTALRLPFDGVWYVVWGGRTIEQNYHAKVSDQRFALDLLIVRDGSSFAGDGKENEDYYAFGAPIVAPGAGVVIAASDAVDDNMPGVMNPKQALGNYVIIDHQNGEFSILAHLQRGSVKVKAGDKIAAGAPLGLCGNSGNSTEAHLHYHIQNTAEPFKSEGLPIFFRGVLIDGVRRDLIEVEQGQQIQNQK